MVRRLFIILSVIFLFCDSAFAAGNKIDGEVYDKTSLSNKFYTNKTEALLLKTGQTTGYHAGDDGDLELGIAHSYTVLTTGRYAGSINVTINSKTYAFPNACVKDNNTGKMWARTVPQSDIGSAADGKLFWEQWTLAAETCTCNATNKTITADAGIPFSSGILCAGRKFTIAGSALGNNGTFTVTSITTSVITVSETVVDENSISLDFATIDDLIWDLVDQANANKLAGYNDWRIPNQYELESIVNLKSCDSAIDAMAFPSTPSDYHWTASTNPCSSFYAWSINFHGGYMYSSVKYSIKSYVRLVRN